MLTTDKKYNVPALEKAIAIIETLSQHNDPVGVSELCKLLDIPKTSVFFILNTLEQHQYIAKTQDGKYTLGTQFINIGLAVLNKIDIRVFARPYLEKLQNETGFTVHLAILDNWEAMYVEKVENNAFVKFSTYIGQRQPLHVTGVGKAIAAYMPEHQLEECLRVKGLPEKTEKTITNVNDFKIALEAIRKQGYAVEDEEGESGVRCVGAPVFDHQGNLKAAISITALRTDLPIHDIAKVGEKVKASALEISAQLGYYGTK
ncbi:IclR family transcriptional regulator [Paenibacillus thalictri]|uniref:IclR family transcriptional regulator n=1 Tax=Paenibacillus thalictri TaxID=2527873 RepID=A0A4Q9DFY4_9BACL|nr:IclR family transcriptional regulator [Paenibacillus thalictri]TBL71065.1 IclR family transcriptional regulator [Paenibacillus thalictri]